MLGGCFSSADTFHFLETVATTICLLPGRFGGPHIGTRPRLDSSASRHFPPERWRLLLPTTERTAGRTRSPAAPEPWRPAANTKKLRMNRHTATMETLCMTVVLSEEILMLNKSYQPQLRRTLLKYKDSRRSSGKAIAIKRAQEQCRAKTPEALQGRKHIDIQTDLYLEELSNVIVATDIECQTDAFLDRPASPLFIPAKSGEDVATQIEEGELFDFDREVQPVLEVLVGKTIEQSLLEVMEEEELACLMAQQRAFHELRNIHLAEVQHLQEKERRHSEEKERRIAQQKEVLKKERETAEKIAARAYTKQYLADLLPAAFTSLRTHGFFNDPVETDIETHFLPWLMDEVNSKLERRYAARELLESIIHEVAEKRLEQFKEPET
ncbi:unnamed protein product [Pleuronectes platessa]|uniref:Radial spoke head 3 n=1 Tax=Pleuronectes platessa TaxID=8262 RepID=A0A9N7Z0I8_PLEPL|nr:unnamed protein product [Pleuronectes platessa]